MHSSWPLRDFRVCRVEFIEYLEQSYAFCVLRCSLFSHVDLVDEVLNRTCDTLFKNTCLKSSLKAVESLKDKQCLGTLKRGPDEKKPGCETANDALKIFQEALTDCSNPCACTTDGVANGVKTDRRGCKKHLELHGDPDYFCYVVESDHCTSENITESGAFPGTFWILCGDSKRVQSSSGLG